MERYIGWSCPRQFSNPPAEADQRALTRAACSPCNCRFIAIECQPRTKTPMRRTEYR